MQEACLSADFACLRPCVDGVEAVIRHCIATAAHSLATQQIIVLEALLSCFSMTLLYSDDVRYGKFMWNIESFFMEWLYVSALAASSTARPRVASSRTRTARSVFAPSSRFSILFQAVVHTATMASGVRYAKVLDKAASEGKSGGFRIQRKSASNKSSQILDQTLANFALAGGRKGENFGLLGRPPFRPNPVTNVVFLFSVFQNAVMRAASCKGSPFHIGVMESREMVLSLTASILFVFACVMEAVPPLNELLQLSPLTTPNAKIVLLGLLVCNALGCYLAERISQYIWHRELWDQRPSLREDYMSTDSSAADMEEGLIHKARRGNTRLVAFAFMLSFKFLLDEILKNLVGRRE